jgi:hypothetical protein
MCRACNEITAPRKTYETFSNSPVPDHLAGQYYLPQARQFLIQQSVTSGVESSHALSSSRGHPTTLRPPVSHSGRTVSELLWMAGLAMVVDVSTVPPVRGRLTTPPGCVRRASRARPGSGSPLLNVEKADARRAARTRALRGDVCDHPGRNPVQRESIFAGPQLVRGRAPGGAGGSNTKITSAVWMVMSRWAMAIVERPA